MNIRKFLGKSLCAITASLAIAGCGKQYSVRPYTNSNGRVTSLSLYDDQNNQPNLMTVKLTGFKEGKSVKKWPFDVYRCEGSVVRMCYTLPIERGRIIPDAVDEIVIEFIRAYPEGRLPEPFRIKITPESFKAYDDELYGDQVFLYNQGVIRNHPGTW